MISAEFIHTLLHLALRRLTSILCSFWCQSWPKRSRNLLSSSGLAYPVWSPYDAVEAAETMVAMVKAAESEWHA